MRGRGNFLNQFNSSKAMRQLIIAMALLCMGLTAHAQFNLSTSEVDAHFVLQKKRTFDDTSRRIYPGVLIQFGYSGIYGNGISAHGGNLFVGSSLSGMGGGLQLAFGGTKVDKVNLNMNYINFFFQYVGKKSGLGIYIGPSITVVRTTIERSMYIGIVNGYTRYGTVKVAQPNSVGGGLMTGLAFTKPNFPLYGRCGVLLGSNVMVNLSVGFNITHETW